MFVQVTADQGEDLDVPEEPYSFGTFVASQALGDMKSLCSRNRRVIRVHLGCDVETGGQTNPEGSEGGVAFIKSSNIS